MCITRNPTGGQWLASGSDDGTLRVWEVATGRCSCSWQLGGSSGSSGSSVEPVVCVAWCPDPKLQLLAAAVGNKLVLLPVGVSGDEVEAAGKAACQVRLGLSRTWLLVTVRGAVDGVERSSGCEEAVMLSGCSAPTRRLYVAVGLVDSVELSRVQDSSCVAVTLSGC